MGYGNTGIYTPPTGAESAVPGAVIKSSTWNSIFTDLSAALTQVAQQAFTSALVTLGNINSYTLASSDCALLVSNASPTVLTLPPVTAGRWLRIKTVNGAVNSASVNISSLTGSNTSVIVGSGVGKYAVLIGDTASGLWVTMQAN